MTPEDINRAVRAAQALTAALNDCFTTDETLNELSPLKNVADGAYEIAKAINRLAMAHEALVVKMARREHA